METEALIRPTAKEEVLRKISQLKQKNLTAERMSNIESLMISIKVSFISLADHYFGLDCGQMRELPDQELEALFLIVTERAGRTSIILKISGLRIIASILEECPRTVRFTDSVHKLKKILGNDFDPVKILRS